MMSAAQGFSKLARLTPANLAAASLLLVISDWGSWMAGSSAVPGGPLDELAHLMTILLFLWALGPRICERFLVPAMIASVAIDLDHVPAMLGTNWLTQGTPRPYTHSLLTFAVVLAGAVLVRRHRDVFLGVALGLVGHFFRDLSERGSGVALLWPWSDHSFNLPHGGYVGVMALFVLLDGLRLLEAWRSRSRLAARNPS